MEPEYNSVLISRARSINLGETTADQNDPRGFIEYLWVEQRNESASSRGPQRF